MKKRLENLEAKRPQPQPEEEPIDLSQFTPKEQAVLMKGYQTIKRLTLPDGRFDSASETKEDCENIVAGARILHNNHGVLKNDKIHT